jgi:hypothetical protein
MSRCELEVVCSRNGGGRRRGPRSIVRRHLHGRAVTSSGNGWRRNAQLARANPDQSDAGHIVVAGRTSRTGFTTRSATKWRRRATEDDLKEMARKARKKHEFRMNCPAASPGLRLFLVQSQTIRRTAPCREVSLATATADIARVLVKGPTSGGSQTRGLGSSALPVLPWSRTCGY